MSEVMSTEQGVLGPNAFSLNSPLQFKTYGCKVNTYDTGLLQKRVEKNLNIQLDRPVHVLNTCAVTREATLEAVREARRIKKKNSNAIVIVTGCAAQVDTDEFKDLSEADLVIANSHKGEIESLLTRYIQGGLTEKVFKSNIFKKEDLEEGGGFESHHTRSFLKIQDGCNSFCTFCVIPFARGKSRSLSITDLRERVNEFSAKGIQEVVLTGVHIGDFEEGLEALVEDLLLNTKMPRLRLASLEPIEISSRLLDCFSDARLCAHFHMSIQSANTEVLAQMKRKYTSLDVENALMTISERVPSAYVGMDVIAGFVGETDEQFEDTYLRLARLPWTRLHVFPYSERPGTFALKYDGKVEPHVIARRASQLRELSWSRLNSVAEKQIGTVKSTLILKNQSAGEAMAVGVARDHWPIEITKASSAQNPLSQDSVAQSSSEQSHLTPKNPLPNINPEPNSEVQVRITDLRPRLNKQDVVLVGEIVERT